MFLSVVMHVMFKCHFKISHLIIQLLNYFPFYCQQEDVANLTMNKYRKAQALVEEAEARADAAEKNLQTVRRSRSVSVTREITRVVKV